MLGLPELSASKRELFRLGPFKKGFLCRSGRTPAKRKLGVRERLSRKLLSGRAAAAAAGELAAVEAASHRERMSNRWEEV